MPTVGWALDYQSRHTNMPTGQSDLSNPLIECPLSGDSRLYQVGVKANSDWEAGPPAWALCSVACFLPSEGENQVSIHMGEQLGY